MASLPPAPLAAGPAIPAPRPAPPDIHRVRMRRRPSGEPPPLPRHLNASGKWWLALSGLVVVVVGVVVVTGTATFIDLVDTRVLQAFAAVRTPWLTRVAEVAGVLATGTALYVLWVANWLLLAGFRRWRHLFVLIGAGIVVVEIASGMAGALQRPRAYDVEILGPWAGFSMPSLPMTVLSALLVSMAYSLIPAGRKRTIAKWVIAGLLVVTALSRLYLAQDHPTDVLAGVIFGVAVPLAAFRLLTPNDVYPVRYSRGRPAHLDVSGSRGEAIIRALQDQLGLIASECKPFGLAGSGGSTPLRITVKGDPDTYVFGKLYAATHVRSDRWYKLGRTLLYGRLEDEQPFHSVRRLVQYEDYVLRVASDAGLPVAHPLGIVEITPEREYLLVAEFFAGAVELGEAEVDTQVIDDGLGIIRKLWDAGLAHRDIKPANLLVRDGRMQLIDVAFVQARPSPWRQAVDLANMMLCLALRSSPQLVYARALEQFSVEEITEGFAAARGLALPSQLRRMLRDQGRDLHGEFIRLLPAPPQPVSIQRWTLRRVGLWALVVAVLVFFGSVIVDSFTTNEAGQTPVNNTSLACTELEALWLQAQAVPSASQVPCVRYLPVGWSVARVTVNDGRSVLTLDHDRAGAAALVVRLTAACTPAGAVEGPSATAGVRHYQGFESRTGQFTATWYDQFPGGCVTSRMHLTTDPNGEFAAQAPQVLGFTSRVALAEALSQRSDGRLQLDPENGR